jgi:hypothetical protein
VFFTVKEPEFIVKEPPVIVRLLHIPVPFKVILSDPKISTVSLIVGTTPPNQAAAAN